MQEKLGKTINKSINMRKKNGCERKNSVNVGKTRLNSIKRSKIRSKSVMSVKTR